MKTVLFIASLLILPLTVYPSGIASVNFKSIKGDLRDYYFSKPGNKEIKERFETAVQEEEKFHEQIHKRMMEGQAPIDFEAVMSMGSSGGPERYKLERKIDADLRRELYLIVRELNLEYDLIYDASDAEAIIFAKRPADDLTAIIRQAIIDHQRKAGSRQTP